MPSMQVKSLIGVLIVDLILVISGANAEHWFGFDPYAGFASVVGGVAITTLFGVMIATQRVRDGIAAAFAATYFVVLAYLIFLPGARTSLFGGATADQGSMLISDLTKFIGIIVASYFGAQAIESGLARFTENRKQD